MKLKRIYVIVILLFNSCKEDEIINPVALAEGKYLCSIYEKNKLISIDRTQVSITRSDSLNKVSLLIAQKTTGAQTLFESVKANLNLLGNEKVDLSFSEPSGDLIGYVWKSDIVLNFIIKKDTVLTLKGKKIEN